MIQKKHSEHYAKISISSSFSLLVTDIDADDDEIIILINNERITSVPGGALHPDPGADRVLS